MGHKKFGAPKAVIVSHKKFNGVVKSISRRAQPHICKRKTNQWARNKVTEIDATLQILLTKPEMFNKTPEKKEPPLKNTSSIMENVGDFEMVLAMTCDKINETFVTDD